MLLSELQLDELHLGFRRALLSMKSGNTIMVARREIDGVYDIHVYMNFGQAARAADARAKHPPTMKQWSNLDTLTAQCVLYEITDGDPVVEQ
jgi:hypothetical protein